MAYRPLEAAEFGRIKSAQANGATIEEVRRKTRRSWDTIKRVFTAPTFGAYKNRDTSVPTVGNSEDPLVTRLKAAREHLLVKAAAIDTTLEVMTSLKGDK